MYRHVTVLVFMVFSYGLCQQQQPGKNINQIIDGIFPKSPIGTKNPEPVPTPGPTPQVTPIPGVNQCVCVPYYLCNNNSRINTNGVGLIDIRADENGCANYLEFCCNPPDVRETPIPVISTTDRKGCGWRNPDGVGFRMQGATDNEAAFGEFTWMVAVLREELLEGSDETLDVYQCGGSLIHPQAVITAAHCVNAKGKKHKVRAGEWDTQTKKEIFPHQDRAVKSVTVHPQYYAGALFNDIAFLLLKSPFKLAENIGVVCLPPQGTVFPTGSRCFVSGWGNNTFGQEGKYQAILKKIDLPIVDSRTCQANLRTTRLGYYFELDKSFICAGGEKDKDTCKGDGGSPLVCPIPGQKDRYQQAGIVAWGIGCGEDQVPGVYANVALFRDWVNEQVAYNNLDITTYEY